MFRRQPGAHGFCRCFFREPLVLNKTLEQLEKALQRFTCVEYGLRVMKYARPPPMIFVIMPARIFQRMDSVFMLGMRNT